MNKHHYRITVEHLTDAQGHPGSATPLQFEIANHDEIFSIIERIRAQGFLTRQKRTLSVLG